MCARVRSPYPVRPDCHLDFSFSVRLVATAGTAGNQLLLINKSTLNCLCFRSVDSSDYGSAGTISFPGCEERACGSIQIKGDNVMELLVEEFSVSLESSTTDSRIRVSAQPSTIRITDDDGECGWFSWWS